MKVGVPGEFHEDRWQLTAEDSEMHVLTSTREASGPSDTSYRVAKRASDRSLARHPRLQIVLRQGCVAKGRKSVPLTGLRSGLRPGLARRPYQQVPQWHPRVAKRDFWPVFGPSGGQHIRRTRGYAASGPQVCIFSAREYVSPVRPPAYSVGPGIFSECPAFQSRS